MLLISCGFVDINFDDIWYFLLGGVIGDVLISLVLLILNIFGIMFVLFFLWGVGIILLIGIFWLWIVEWIGECSIVVFVGLFNCLCGEKVECVKLVLVKFELLVEELELIFFVLMDIEIDELVLSLCCFNIYMLEECDVFDIYFEF